MKSNLVGKFCCVLWCAPCLGSQLFAAEPAPNPGAPASAAVTNAPAAITNSSPHFNVRGFETRGDRMLPLDAQAAVLTKYTGTNVSLADLVKAASDLQSEYRNRGDGTVSVAIAQERITNGVVTMNVFRGLVPQILVSGVRYSGSTGQPVPASQLALANTAPNATNAAPATRTNAGPHFVVRGYEIRGDTLLSTNTLMDILVKHTGTNIGIGDITKAASELQMEYRDRGFPTVSVTIPQQELTNGIVKIRVFQGRLSDISVTGNHYFSSNNVIRALPSLRTNVIMNGLIFQAELDRANANQDRQIYPQIQPGAEPNTTELLLKVKDRLPLHAKIELNDQGSPGTPELRINTSAVYNNLWELEHSMGVQYSFSPEAYKTGEQWDFYDVPLVANYSGFYRMPLGNPEAVSETIATKPGTFGYDEATRKFRLPPASGRPELNVYASRSAIDTGLETTFSGNLFNTNGNSLDRRDVQQDLTINSDIGFRLTIPVSGSENFNSGFSGGFDYKGYDITSSKTNIFTLSQVEIDNTSNPPKTNTIVSVDSSPVPTTHRKLDYLPLALRYDASLRDSMGITSFGLGFSGNPWHSGFTEDVQEITGSLQSSGHWLVINPSLSRDFFIHTNWVLSARADGQWASEPLISNEQFGVGGINSVRGYREGEVFGDNGWHVSLEQKTPPQVVGLVSPRNPLTLRGAVYMDYGEAYLIDPNGRDGRIPLWGTGFGGVATIGSHWEARFLFSWPLLRTTTTEPGVPRFDFSLTAQF
ncbi:MAG TPA: POTRA domain-containing protein [Candidatus Binatia bacterium]|jgi:hemolysin activation/secretion protein|nr:POTRA domain-containing protein [Candidatus Binatia bacterium]